MPLFVYLGYFVFVMSSYMHEFLRWGASRRQTFFIITSWLAPVVNFKSKQKNHWGVSVDYADTVCTVKVTAVGDKFSAKDKFIQSSYIVIYAVACQFVVESIELLHTHYNIMMWLQSADVRQILYANAKHISQTVHIYLRRKITGTGRLSVVFFFSFLTLEITLYSKPYRYVFMIES